jgi:hypothetical protein
MRKLKMMAMLATIPATIATGVSANGFYFDPGLAVNPVNSSQFEVIEGRGEGPRGIWCAASLYALNTLGIDRGRLYIASPRGNSQTVNGRKGVVFSTQVVGAVAASTSITVRQAGSNLPVQHALQFCRDYDYDLFGSLAKKHERKLP